MKGLSLKITIVINTGAALLLWAMGFFGMLWMSQHHPAIERLFPVAMGGWTGGLVAILFKQYSNNKLDLEAARSGPVTVANLDVIKAQGGSVYQPIPGKP